MKLEPFFAAIAPFLEGKETHAQAVAALYDDRHSGLHANDLDPTHSSASAAPASAQAAANRLHANDIARLVLYGRFCHVHRLEALASTFAQTRAAVIRRAGEPAWEALVADYFAAHPMRHAELNENGSELPAFLARTSAGREFPSWLPELADLEWWSFRTRVALDDPRDASPEAGPLRLGATAELRPYTHDLPAWLAQLERLDADALHANDLAAASIGDAPPARACIVLFWRDLDLDTRFAEANPLELAILHALVEARPLSDAAERTGSTAEALEETVADLVAAGILLGARAV